MENFRDDFLIKRHNVWSIYSGTETASFIGPKIWETLPHGCNDVASLKSFKESFKSWIPENYSNRLCKNYIKCVGFPWQWVSEALFHLGKPSLTCD